MKTRMINIIITKIGEIDSAIAPNLIPNVKSHHLMETIHETKPQRMQKVMQERK
jgi:hypothetical protein